MIRTLLVLLPPGSRRTVASHVFLTVVSVALRAAGVVLMVPLVGALFGTTPSDAWPWLGALTGVTIAGWIVDMFVSLLGFNLGFGLLNHAQNEIAERTARIRLTWFTGENTATNRQAIAATGPDLVGLIVYLVTPILSAILLPLAIAIALLPISWVLGVAALAGVPILLGASCSRPGSAAAPTASLLMPMLHSPNGSSNSRVPSLHCALLDAPSPAAVT